MSATSPFAALWAEDDTAPRKPARSSWALMGDIHAYRGGVPEILIEWRRAQGEELPEPQLPELRK
ncbi:MAG: hypothetical protein AAFO80_07275 [Pseudomonadota bacterium]